MPVKILIEENGTIDALVSAQRTEVEIIANVMRKGDTMRLEGVHVELLTGGLLDRQMIELLCGEFCAHFDIESLSVQGARRTTGRSAGKIPRPIVYRVPK